MRTAKTACQLALTLSILAQTSCSTLRRHDTSFIVTSGTPPSWLAVKINIHDDQRHSWRFWDNKAHLFLKITSSSTPDISWLCPLNIDMPTAGNRTVEATTPFLYQENKTAILAFELLDDTSFTRQEEDLLVEASRTGAGILTDGVNYYATAKRKPVLIDSETRQNIESVFGDTAKVIVAHRNKLPFDSFGSCDFNVYSTGPIQISNPVTVCDENNRRRCDITVHLIPK